MISLRHMDKSDLHRVNLILSKSFTQGRIEEGYKETRVPLVRIEFLEMYFAACPSGCYVFEVNGDIVAYAFSRLWGTVGWIGPLAVVPEFQGQALGKEMVLTCVDFLKESGAQTIGLETMPRSYKNLGLYSRLDFVPQSLTVEMTKTVYPKPEGAPPVTSEFLRYSDLSSSDRGAFLTKVRELSNLVASGLDYTLEVKLAHEFRYGDSLLMLRGSQPVGFGVCHTEPYSSEEKREILRLNIVVMYPTATVNDLSELLEAFADLARSEYLTTLCVRVPTRCAVGYRHLLSQNFRVVHSDLRMTLEGYPERDDPRTIHFSKWE